MKPKLEIRRTVDGDVDTLLSIYDSARLFMRRTGNALQWNNGYPSRATLEADIAEGNSYVLETDGEVIATFYFKTGEEPTYLHIFNGNWLSSQPYGVIHRVASNGTCSGVMAAILDYCLSQCDNIRIDTHRDNIVMQRALLRYGFSFCGIIYLANGDERLAYQFLR